MFTFYTSRNEHIYLLFRYFLQEMNLINDKDASTQYTKRLNNNQKQYNQLNGGHSPKENNNK